MGWNSWDCFGTTVTAAEVKANADYMARQLARYGWRYVVVDIQWYEPQAKAHGYRPNAELLMDEYGRLTPAVNRFPSAAGGKGFKPLAGYVHSKGLKFGIHIMRGIPRQAVRANTPVFGSRARAQEIADQTSVCGWNTDMFGLEMTRPGAQDYYDSILKLYAEWGVDFIKADNMLDPYHAGEIAALSRAIRKTGRPIVLSLSPGPAEVARVAHLSEFAQTWRVSGDFWDRWRDLKRQFTLLPPWAEHARPGAWPDADMLPLGHIGIRAERGVDRMTLLTRDEQRTLMTLWSVARSPLMFGGHLPSNDAWTLSLLANAEVLAVNQRATRSRELFARGNQVAWVAERAGSKARYLAVFHIGDSGEEEIRVDFSELGLPSRCALRDLWEKKNLGIVSGGRAFRLTPHSAGFYRLTPVT